MTGCSRSEICEIARKVGLKCCKPNLFFFITSFLNSSKTTKFERVLNSEKSIIDVIGPANFAAVGCYNSTKKLKQWNE